MTKINKLSDFSGEDNLTSIFLKINEIIDVINSLALSDKEECLYCERNIFKICPNHEPKQEEWKGCGICNCKYPQFCEGCYKADYKCRVCDNEPKQSTSLKEAVLEIMDESLKDEWENAEQYRDKILSLVQSRACENCKHKFEYGNNN